MSQRHPWPEGVANMNIVENMRTPAPAAGQNPVQVTAVGISGSDLHTAKSDGAVTKPPEPTFSAAELPGLCDTVTSLDPDLQRIVDEYGYPEFWNRPNTFESFVWFILEQQVSLASAKAALGKLRDRVGAITPANVLALTDDELRAVYFSRQKTAYVRGLAHKMETGDLDLASLETLTDSAIRERLIRLNGVGNWTVDVYLIIVLHRLDMFPAGDLAAVNGLKDLKGLPRTTPKKELATATQLWAPYRTIGTMLVWHFYLSRRAPRRHA